SDDARVGEWASAGGPWTSSRARRRPLCPARRDHRCPRRQARPPVRREGRGEGGRTQDREAAAARRLSERALEHRTVFVLIRRFAFHPRGYVPIGELHRALVPQTRLLSDELADEKLALLEHTEERGAIRQSIRITQQPEAPRSLSDLEMITA